MPSEMRSAISQALGQQRPSDLASLGTLSAASGNVRRVCIDGEKSDRWRAELGRLSRAWDAGVSVTHSAR